jgi:RNA polymerase primary sigma factor
VEERLRRLLDELSQPDADILRFRFGLADGEVHTLEETGEKFGLTRERIRQVEHEFLNKKETRELRADLSNSRDIDFLDMHPSNN